MKSFSWQVRHSSTSMSFFILTFLYHIFDDPARTLNGTFKLMERNLSDADIFIHKRNAALYVQAYNVIFLLLLNVNQFQFCYLKETSLLHLGFSSSSVQSRDVYVCAWKPNQFKCHIFVVVNNKYVKFALNPYSFITL